jgi:hypothetical protein
MQMIILENDFAYLLLYFKKVRNQLTLSSYDLFIARLQSSII